MSPPLDRDRPRVSAMIETVEEAKRDASGGEASFVESGLVQKAVLLDPIPFTESADKTSASLRRLNPRILWARLSRLRNRGLVHEYLEVDLEDLWAFLRDEVPRLRRQLDRIVYPVRSD